MPSPFSAIVEPMLALSGPLPMRSEEYAFEFKWDGTCAEDVTRESSPFRRPLRCKRVVYVDPRVYVLVKYLETSLPGQLRHATYVGLAKQALL